MDAPFKIRFFIDVEGFDLYTREIEMPYLPRQGDNLGVGREGDYHQVESFNWAPDQGFTIYLRDLLEVEKESDIKLILGPAWKPFVRPTDVRNFLVPR